MNVEQKVNIHNRFDVEVNGEWVGYAENIVLDQMWTRLCGGLSYFVNIHFGTGAGTPIATRTTLFTHLGTKVAVDVEQIKALPVSRWKRKVVLNPEEFVGSTITEVGIAFGATNTNLVTHAMLKDAEGNPITITKTATDVVTIYATIFVTLNVAAGISILGIPSNNQLINYLIGGAGAPTGSFGLVAMKNAASRLGSTANATWTVDTANKKRKTNTPRFDINTGNGHVKFLTFDNLFNLELPTAGIFTGQPYNAVPVGTGDGIKTKFTLPSANINQATLAMKIAGAVVNNYTKNILYSEYINVNVDVPTPGTCYGIALTPDGLVMAVGHNFSPFISTYDWIGGAWVKRPNPASLPAGYGAGVSLSADGLVMAVGHSLSPYITTYDWVGGAWVKRPDPTSLPAGNASGVSLSADGLVMAISHDTMYYISTYDWVGGVWVKRPNPAILPVNPALSISLSANGLVMAVGHFTSPFITTYDWVGGVWVKRPTPTSLPGYNGVGVALSTDGLVLAVAHGNNTPFCISYDWVGGAWIKRPDPVSPPSSIGNAIALTPDGLVMAVGHNISPFVTTYDWVGGAWVKRPNPASLPAGDGYGVALTSDGRTISVTHKNSPYIATYKPLPFTEVTFDTPVAAAQAITADYTVDGLHKTNQYVVDVSFAIAFGEGV